MQNRELEEIIILRKLLRIVDAFLIYPDGIADRKTYMDRMREVVIEHRDWKSTQQYIHPPPP